MMIQEIAPHTLDNAYVPYAPQHADLVLAFDKGELLVNRETGRPYTYEQVMDWPFTKEDSFVYLFAVDGRHCFLAPHVPAEFIAQ